LDLERLKIDRAGSGSGPGSASRSRRRRRRAASRWVVRGVLIALLASGAWYFRAPLRAFVDRFALPAVEVAVVVERGPEAAAAASGAAANGYIVARTRAALSADTPGRIVELNVREGQPVPAGFLVARLYSDEYAAALRRAEADLAVGAAAVERAEAQRDAAEADVRRLDATLASARAAHDEAESDRRLATLQHERATRLVADGIETDDRLDETRTRLETTAARATSSQSATLAAGAALAQGRARVVLETASVAEARAQLVVLEAVRDQARATLEKTEVRAPFSGVVVLKDAEVGEVVSPNSTAGSNARGSVVTMVDFASLEVQAEVPETSLSAVRLGAPVRIFLDAFPDKPYAGRVDRIWPTANRQKATIEVRAIFDTPDERLRPEMGLRVVFLDRDAEATASYAGAGPTRVLIVPAASVVREAGQPAVFVLERDVARRRPVTLGDRLGEQQIVVDGLSVDERVIVDPPATLASGDRVRVASP